MTGVTALPAAGALDHVDCWIFDLDNTLYPPTADLFLQIDERMKAFIGRELGLSPDDAYRLQKTYYRAHGTTLRGLMLNHGTDPEAFLDYVHDIDHTVLGANPALRSSLAGLPGRRFIYTNGTRRHADQVLHRLGIADLFDGAFDIRAGTYLPKPDPAPYREMVRTLGVDPTRAAMFEDSFKNLAPAAAMGMVTVWVRHPEHTPGPGDETGHCRYVTDDLVAWLDGLSIGPPASAQGASQQRL
jgi:putative hydrolase of the HAD superfamily